jgi:rRNA processing protein Krr1/Pno1
MGMMYANEEPTADQREAAKATRGIYVALIKEGFTEDQALKILGTMIAASFKKE